MIDAEDLTKSVINYLREEFTIPVIGDISRLNLYIRQMNEKKGDDLVEDIVNSDTRFVLAQRLREQQTFKAWIDIYIDEEVACNSTFDTIAKSYSININAMIKDDTSDNTFYRSMRMAEILNNLMVDYFKESQEYGFMLGEVDKSTYPERIVTSVGKTLQSGVTYNIIIQ